MAMADAPSKVRWDKENVRIFTFKLFRKNDEDVIEYLEPRNKRDIICAALREYMANHNEKGEE